jgi:hypothetical protein
MKGAHSYSSVCWVCHLSGPTRLYQGWLTQHNGPLPEYICAHFELWEWHFQKKYLCNPRLKLLQFSKEDKQAFSYPHQVPGAKNCYDIHVRFWKTETFVSMTWGIMLHVLLAVPCYHTNKMVAIFCCWYLMYRAILYCAVVHAGILHVTTSLPFEQNSCWALPCWVRIFRAPIWAKCQYPYDKQIFLIDFLYCNGRFLVHGSEVCKWNLRICNYDVSA